MGICYTQFLIIFLVLPLTYAYATLRQSVAGNSTFWGIIFCNVVDIFMCVGEILVSLNKDVALCLPHIFPHMTPHDDVPPVDKKNSRTKKTCSQECSNSFLAHKLSTFVLFNWFFLFGRLRVPTRCWDLLVPEAGGGSVQTRLCALCNVWIHMRTWSFQKKAEY